jgi:predicted component of type VI protein secretion system
MLQAKLKVVGGKHHGKTIAVPKGKFLIGREQDCQLRPNSELVSRHHCVIHIDDFTVRLRDLGSTNGTFVNGNRVRGEMTLKAGDRVRVGKLDFEILIPDPNAVETAPVATGDSSRGLAAASETAQLSTSETSFEIPLPGDLPDTGSSVLPNNGDTTVIGPIPGSEEPTTAIPAPPVPYAQDPYQQMPQYPQPPVPYQQPAYPWIDALPRYGVSAIRHAVSATRDVPASDGDVSAAVGRFRAGSDDDNSLRRNADPAGEAPRSKDDRCGQACSSRRGWYRSRTCGGRSSRQ